MVIFHDEPDALDFVSDEVHLHLNGFVNDQNCRYWGRKIQDNSMRPNSSRVTVLCVILDDIGQPTFLKKTG